ncbi:putative PurR-regulated permease PerM [Roseiarcus fermentans]|uniref:Putative PurR-regulated permease PerM n=1 Tax=Roseiarcus fermentans TaxID=1473586 RepID=A0A366EPZ0_9HYPH|nr:AI-2E family transporter [Roseiarcus fermentans]RBP03760.1 putative PurR-regulated permease PerM [Roseiarcus fermentans]
MSDRRPRPIPAVIVDESAQPVDRLRLLSVWSAASIAVVAVGAALFVAREMLLPIVTAFVVGVMLSPLAKALEARRIPRVVSAALIVLITALLIALIVGLIATPVAELAEKLPAMGDKLHTFDGLFGFWRRVEASLGIHAGGAAVALPEPSISWVPTTIGYISPPVTGLLYFLVVLLLFISWWPDLRRQLVMTFASRDSRLRVLRILNEVEDSLAGYLVTVTSINLAVGAAAGLIALATGLPTPIGFGTLAATLNFIPIVGPIAMTAVLAVVGVVTGATLGMGLLPAALFMLVVFVEGQFITPAIIGRKIEINALAVLLSLMFWSWMWGPMGAFLSSPLLIVGLILHDHLAPEQRP